MATRPLKERVFLLGGDAEHASVLALPPLFSPEGSQNMHVNKEGELESMAGYDKLNAAAITTDTGATATKVVGLYHYRSRSGVTITRREVAVVDDGVNEYEIWHSTDGGATWSFLKDMGAAAVGLLPDFAQLDDTLIITFGPAINAQTYNGTAVADAGASQPTGPAVAVVAGITGNLDGIYQYRIAQIDKSEDPDIDPASLATTEVVVNKGKLKLTSLPAVTDDGIRIFRTTGDGSVFFKVADVTTNADYTDNLHDRDLQDLQVEISQHGDSPVAGMQFNESHRDRIFYADEDTIYPSDVGFPQSVGPDLSFKTVMGQGDINRGMSGEFDGELIMWTEQSIVRLQGSGRQTWNQIPTAASIGTVHHRATALVPSNAKAVDAQGNPFSTGSPTYAFMAPDKTIRLFDGRNDTDISAPVKDTLATMSYALRANCWAVEVPSYDWIVFAICTAAGTFTYIAWDYARGIWHNNIGTFWTGLAHSVVAESASASEIVMAGEASTAVGGFIYQLFTGTDADGSNITNKVRTVPLPAGVPDRPKLHMSIQPFFRALASATNATVNVYKGFVNTSASAYVALTFSMQAANANVADPDPQELMDTTNARYVDDEAIVLEVVVAGKVQWALMGWAHEFIVTPDTVVR